MVHQNINEAVRKKNLDQVPEEVQLLGELGEGVQASVGRQTGLRVENGGPGEPKERLLQ